jgi:hypothetical protein
METKTTPTEEALITLAECPPGVFEFNGSLGFKTEYGMSLPDSPDAAKLPGDQVRFKVTHWPDAYVLESGECFWGGTSTHEERAKLLVKPVEVVARHQTSEANLIERVADFLVDQRDEPWPNGTEGDRLHYWRDKAIKAASALRALASSAGSDDLVREALTAAKDVLQNGGFKPDWDSALAKIDSALKSMGGVG